MLVHTLPAIGQRHVHASSFELQGSNATALDESPARLRQMGEYSMAINRRKEGYRAYQNGLPVCMCPYGLLPLHDETQEAKDWLEGWYEGEDQYKRLFGVARRADPC